MVRCEVCDGEDFELQDGLYYCTMCQTQSQDLVEEEQSDGEFPTPGESNSTGTRRLRIHTKKNAPKKNFFGNMWTTHDAYNLILANQVKALISLGASQELKTVVLNLWTRYLEKNCVAYLKKKKFRRRMSFYPRLRDIEVIIGHCSELVPKQRIFKNAVSVKKRRKDSISAKTGSESEVSELDDHYPSESDTMTDYGYLSESIVETSDTDKSEESDSDASVGIRRGIARVEGETKLMNRWALGRSIRRMNLSLTLAFLYLGLLLLKEQILLSDILRWAWEDRIPLYNTADVFPEDMKFQLFDNQTFRLQHAISNERVRSDTGRLAKFLDISEIAWNPLEYIAARFIKELSLPGVMFGMVSNLIAAYPSNTYWESDRRCNIAIPNYEGKAIAYIIIALKLLFALNGESEWIISKYCKGLIHKQEFGDILPFDFCEWRKQTSIKYWLSSLNWRRGIRAKITNRPVDLDELIQFYLETGYKWKGKFCLDRTQRQKTEAKLENLYKAICDVFKMLTTAPVVKRGNRASSFPLLSEAKDVLIKYSKVIYRNFESSELCNPKRSDFSQTSLDFLLKSPSSRVNNREIGVDARKATKKHLKIMRKPYSKWLTAYKKYHLVNLSARTMSKLKGNTLKTAFPLLSSTSWLVNILAYVAEMKPESIYQEVTLLENSVLKLKRNNIKKKHR